MILDIRQQLLAAEGIARAAHATQFRRNQTTPYTTHVEKVVGFVRGDHRAEIVAWLHDVVKLFDMIANLTDEPNAAQRSRYLQGINHLLSL